MITYLFHVKFISTINTTYYMCINGVGKYMGGRNRPVWL
jgi:hypothetical protein